MKTWYKKLLVSISPSCLHSNLIIFMIDGHCWYVFTTRVITLSANQKNWTSFKSNIFPLIEKDRASFAHKFFTETSTVGNSYTFAFFDSTATTVKVWWSEWSIVKAAAVLSDLIEMENGRHEEINGKFNYCYFVFLSSTVRIVPVKHLN